MIFQMTAGPIPPRKGRPHSRDAKHYLVALKFILWPTPRPWALQKQLAMENGISESDLSSTVLAIKRGSLSCKTKGKRQ